MNNEFLYEKLFKKYQKISKEISPCQKYTNFQKV